MLKDDDKLRWFQCMVNVVAKSANKERYKSLYGSTDIHEWFVTKKIGSFRPGMFPLNYRYKPIVITESPIIKFLRNETVEITNTDATGCIEQYKSHGNAFIFCDPPYLSTFNTFYKEVGQLNIYEYIHYLRNFQCRVILCLEDHWMIQLMFNGRSTTIMYDKKYEFTKRKTKHCLITLTS
jgi:hypothetical protein